MIAAMALGGTKTVVAIGEKDGTLGKEHRFPMTTPDETFETAIAWFKERGTPEANWSGFSTPAAGAPSAGP